MTDTQLKMIKYLTSKHHHYAANITTKRDIDSLLVHIETTKWFVEKIKKLQRTGKMPIFLGEKPWVLNERKR